MGNTFGVEPFHVSYGASFDASRGKPLDLECEIVEDGGTLTCHDPVSSAAPDRLAFVDGTMATEARLTRVEDDGAVSPGLAGCWAAGAVLAEAGQRPLVDGVSHGRVTVFGGGRATRLPDQPGGWRWDALSVDDLDPEVARQRIQRRMREEEGLLAEELCAGGWLPVVDGPLNNVRRSRTVAIVGYVKTHARRMLASDAWARVPDLAVGQRTSIFKVPNEIHACYLRIGPSGPWATPWGGIVRLEVPDPADGGFAALESAAAWLPRYASAPHRDPRAPVNLTPIGGLEQTLRRRTGDRGLALRAVRAAVMQLNDREATP